jgi:small subunit ribosomal protein S6
MSRTYEIMFLIDNNAVRAGWKDVKAQVAGLIEKHGGKVLTSRRWDERKLTYPIRQRRRATYLLAYCELAGPGVATLRRELDISETVLRYLLLRAEAVPAQEHELTQAESAAGFQIPEPPPDDARADAELEELEEEPEVAVEPETEGLEEPVTAGREGEEV